MWGLQSGRPPDRVTLRGGMGLPDSGGYFGCHDTPPMPHGETPVAHNTYHVPVGTCFQHIGFVQHFREISMKSLVIMLFLVVVSSQAAAGQPPRRPSKVPVKKPAVGIPTAKLETVEDQEKVAWDYMIWHDAKGRQMRAKLLSVEGQTLRMVREGGKIFELSLDCFSKEDQELVKDFQASEERDKELSHIAEELTHAVQDVLKDNPGETAIRRAALQESQQKAFLKDWDGRALTLRFPIDDISEAERTPGVYRLVLGSGDGALHSMPLRLTKTEAAWVEKGDTLVVKGRATFSFWSLSKKGPPQRDYWLSWSSQGGGDFLTMQLQAPTFSVERHIQSGSLKKRIEARIAELKALEAKEESEKEKGDEKEPKGDPFK